VHESKISSQNIERILRDSKDRSLSTHDRDRLGILVISRSKEQKMIYFVWITAFVVGIIFGTHMPWYFEAIAVVFGIVIVSVGNLWIWEGLELLLPIFATIFFAIGCLIGDISWAVQTDNLPAFGQIINSIGNLFTVE
jgi:uncharacterized membrane protein YoaK (UPF0700 family)